MSHYGPEFVKKAQELRKAAPPDYAAVEKTAQDLVGSAIQFKIGEIFHKAAAQVKAAEKFTNEDAINLVRKSGKSLEGTGRKIRNVSYPTSLAMLGASFIPKVNKVPWLRRTLRGGALTGGLAGYIGGEGGIRSGKGYQRAADVAAGGKFPEQHERFSMSPSAFREAMQHLTAVKNQVGGKEKAVQVKTAGPTPGVGTQLLDQTQRLVRALTRSVDKELVGVERLRKELEASGRLRPTSKTPGASPTPKTPAELMAAHERATKRYGDALHGRLPSGHSPVSKVRGTPAYPEGLSVPKFTGRPTLPESGYPSKLKGGKFLRDIGSKVMGLPPWAQLLLGAAGAAGGTVGVHALLKKKDKKQEKVAGIWETLTGQRTSKLTPVRTGKVDPAWKPYPASAAGLPMPATPPAQPKVQQAGMLPSVPKPDSGKLRSIATGGVDSRMRRAGL